jgi:hypothetical protein
MQDFIGPQSSVKVEIWPKSPALTVINIRTFFLIAKFAKKVKKNYRKFKSTRVGFAVTLLKTLKFKILCNF